MPPIHSIQSACLLDVKGIRAVFLKRWSQLAYQVVCLYAFPQLITVSTEIPQKHLCVIRAVLFNFSWVTVNVMLPFLANVFLLHFYYRVHFCYILFCYYFVASFILGSMAQNSSKKKPKLERQNSVTFLVAKQIQFTQLLKRFRYHNEVNDNAQRESRMSYCKIPLPNDNTGHCIIPVA